MLDIKRLKNSFKYAFEGLLAVLKTEQNIKIHIICGILVLLAGFGLGLSGIKICILLLTIAMVIIAELFNTCIERLVDLVTEDYHPLAKAAKDISAGAVLLAAIVSVFIGIIIFGQALINSINNIL